MVTSELENRQSDPDGLVAAAQEFLATLDEQAQIRQRREEGRAIADIVESLGLPSSVVAAVFVYPLLRDPSVRMPKMMFRTDGSRPEF